MVSCKILEHICKHIPLHLDKHEVLTNLQRGFRSRYSCETQLLITIHDILQAFDNKLQTDIVILDFSKAFAIVSHDHLLLQFKDMGIGEILNKLIKTFLTTRSLRFVVDGISSEAVILDSRGDCLLYH